MKDRYELERNTINVPQTSDSCAERLGEDDPEVSIQRTPFDVPQTQESEESSKDSKLEEKDSGPKTI